MIKKIIHIFSLLEKKQQRKIIYLQLLILLTATMEVISLFAIAPFISILSDFNIIYQENYISSIYSFFDFKSPKIFLFTFAIIFLCILLLSNLIHMITIWVVTLSTMKMGTSLGNRLFSFFINQNWLFHTKSNSSKLINKIAQESDRLTIGIILPAIMINAKLMISLFLILAMIIYNPLIALVVGLVLGISYIVIFQFIKNSVIKNGKIISHMQEARFKSMSEGFGGIREILISGRQNYFSKFFQNKSDIWADAVGKNYAIGQLPRYIVELIAFSLIVGFILYAIVSDVENNFTSLLPTLSIYALGGVKLLPAFQAIFAYLTAIKSNISAYENLKENLIENKKEKLKKPTITNKIDQISEVHLMEELRFEDVSFKYSNKDSQNGYIVSNLNFTINKNQSLGIVGKSGSGKSTIIDLISGLILPDKGKVLVNRKELNQSKILYWQKNISLVSQSIFLADSSIRENIAFGIPSEQIDDSKINLSIQQSQLKDFVSQLPNGVNTLIGERGVQLSGGQRQRIGIARSLYSDSNLIIFDEATSSLDSLTEDLLLKSINNIKKTKTIVIVSHNLSSVKHCHKILFVDKGKILDTGSFDELINRNELFKKMSEVRIG